MSLVREQKTNIHFRLFDERFCMSTKLYGDISQKKSYLRILSRCKECEYRRGFGLGIRFTDHFSTQLGARGSVVGLGTMLQAGRSPVRVPDKVDFLNLPNPSSGTMALGSTQSLTEMSTRNLPGVKGGRSWQPYRHLWAECLKKCGSLNLSQP
jgi:hypothetical protein